jgi:5-methylcytosine-specific restriction endonuclease McrA
MSYSRADRKGAHRANYERNRKRIFATQNTCGICGHPVDFGLKAPHPMSAAVDHIIPVAKNGHPSDIDNLQLAHWTCNRQKSDKIFKTGYDTKPEIIGNRNLPQSMDWVNYNNNAQTSESPKKTVIRVKRRVKE